MAVKIKSINQTKTKRKCFICDKVREMEKNQRFCSPACRNAARDIDKYGKEAFVNLR